MGNQHSSPPLPPPPYPPPSAPPWERREWAPPATYSLLAIGLVFGVSHFCWVERRAGWAAFRSDRQVRAASFTSSPRVSESTLLLVRAAIFGWCFFILAQSAFHEGPGCLRFFTVWNFVVLTSFFGIGTGGLSKRVVREASREWLVLSVAHTLIPRPLVHLLPPRRDAWADHARPPLLGGAAQAVLRDPTLTLTLTLT